MTLQSLNLRDCENITDAGLAEVGRGCSNLQSLNLINCYNITDACKHSLRQIHPQLDLEEGDEDDY